MIIVIRSSLQCNNPGGVPTTKSPLKLLGPIPPTNLNQKFSYPLINFTISLIFLTVNSQLLGPDFHCKKFTLFGPTPAEQENPVFSLTAFLISFAITAPTARLKFSSLSLSVLAHCWYISLFSISSRLTGSSKLSKPITCVLSNDWMAISSNDSRLR